MSDVIDLSALPEDQRTAYYGTLFAMASADGSFDKAEMSLIHSLLETHGMSAANQERIDAWKQAPPTLAACLDVLAAAGDELRCGVLVALVDIALADRQVDPAEAEALDGKVFDAFAKAGARDGIAPLILQSHARACLDATQDAERLLRDALGAKKLKELRRQRNRLAEHGAVAFEVASSPSDVSRALESFLALEASGWKARRGTALAQHDGDARFIRTATGALAAHGQCQIVTLRAGARAVAAGIVLRHQDRAFFFKLGIDETFARCSPGVQLTLELTRHLCADPAITAADSTAAPGHPMIDPIWRGRLPIGDVLIPLRRDDTVVAAIRSALALRTALRANARRALHAIRQVRETSS